MRFEYNGHLLEEDRIKLVAKEIIDQYPKISIEKAKDAAMLEGKISSKKTVNDELNRLYNIMLVNSENKNIVILVYKDFLKLLKKTHIKQDNSYIYLVEEINKYFEGYAKFPLISDYQ